MIFVTLPTSAPRCNKWHTGYEYTGTKYAGTHNNV